MLHLLHILNAPKDTFRNSTISMQNKFKVLDESGDKKYFTIIPNYIVNHSTVYEQAIYLYMKRKAGEIGTCWTSAQEIGKSLGCSRNTVKKYRDKLVQREWLKIVGRKKIGETNQSVLEYQIVDLWELNNEYYKSKHKVSSVDILKVSGDDKKVSTGDLKVSPGVHKEEPIYNNPLKTTVAATSAADINLLIDNFKTVNISYKKFFANKVQRKSLENLLGQFPVEKIQKVIALLPQTNTKEYLPTITTPCQLEEKWSALAAGLIKIKNKGGGIVSI